MTEKAPNRSGKVTARVISWQPGLWGVAVDYGNGEHAAYPVGETRAVAESEARLVEQGRASLGKYLRDNYLRDRDA